MIHIHTLMDIWLGLTTERKVFSILLVVLLTGMFIFVMYDLFFVRRYTREEKRKLVRTTKHSDKDFFDKVTTYRKDI